MCWVSSGSLVCVKDDEWELICLDWSQMLTDWKQQLDISWCQFQFNSHLWFKMENIKPDLEVKGRGFNYSWDCQVKYPMEQIFVLVHRVPDVRGEVSNYFFQSSWLHLIIQKRSQNCSLNVMHIIKWTRHHLSSSVSDLFWPAKLNFIESFIPYCNLCISIFLTRCVSLWLYPYDCDMIFGKSRNYECSALNFMRTQRAENIFTIIQKSSKKARRQCNKNCLDEWDFPPWSCIYFIFLNQFDRITLFYVFYFISNNLSTVWYYSSQICRMAYFIKPFWWKSNTWAPLSQPSFVLFLW